MFGKKNDETAEPEFRQPVRTPDPDVRVRSVSKIGPTVHFKGELSASEDLVIEGHIEGTISHQDKNLTIGKNGRVYAELQAKSVEVLGEVEGNINCTDVVHLHKTANVVGDLSAPRVVLDDGATFTGRVDMGKAQEAARRARLKIADTSGNASSHGT